MAGKKTQRQSKQPAVKICVEVDKYAIYTDLGRYEFEDPYQALEFTNQKLKESKQKKLTIDEFLERAKDGQKGT